MLFAAVCWKRRKLNFRKNQRLDLKPIDLKKGPPTGMGMKKPQNLKRIKKWVCPPKLGGSRSPPKKKESFCKKAKKRGLPPKEMVNQKKKNWVNWNKLTK